jgi:mannose-6-phosphate isomerase-like protein (cupin superfamily)
MTFAARRLPPDADTTAPDGSSVRVLVASGRGSMAHFELAPGKVSLAVAHRSVEELWYVLAGRGEMWLKLGGREEVVELDEGVILSIPAGTHFQFRCLGDQPLRAVGVTMPPWPGPEEAYPVDGRWTPSV